ncbi:MAG: DUF177 domain-containing protein [Rhizobiales bacterium]|jgi:uncharacterized metal-binding protein YceD (DUF177 family)|nr:DUF177 domain-containing protein [Hyphomicrobiales bacterium]
MTDEPFFSHPIRVDDIPDRGMDITIDVPETDRERLAKVLNLAAIAMLTGHFALKRKGREVIAKGEVKAHIEQICVVSLDPFETDVVEAVDLRFSPDAPDLDDEEAPLDSPDPIVNGMIDLGSLVAEFLALSLDPYPRKPGVEFKFELDTEEEHPFAALKKLT